MRSWSRDIGPLLLDTLADTFTEYAEWEKGGGLIKGRFLSDPYEVPTGSIMPGIGEVQTWFYCNRRRVPLPWPELGDHLTIGGQVWEIVQRDEDDLGEFGYRLIKDVLEPVLPDPQRPTVWDSGVTIWDGGATVWDQAARPQPEGPTKWDTASPEGPTAWDAGGTVLDQPADPRRPQGRPSRREEIAQAFDAAATAGIIGPDMPLSQAIDTVRQRIPGDRRGLGDRTIRGVIQQRPRWRGRNGQS